VELTSSLEKVGQTKRTLKQRLCKYFRDTASENLEKNTGYGCHYSKVNHHLGIQKIQLYDLHLSDKAPTDQVKQSREMLGKKMAVLLTLTSSNGSQY
jgi:hypothetical protein